MMAHHARHHPLDGTTNLRDLGGYMGDGGRIVKWGIVFRSDHLAEVSCDDAKRILCDKLHIRHSFDLRGDDECSVKNYDHEGIKRHHVPVDPVLLSHARDSGRELTEELTLELMLETYRLFVSEYSESFGDILRFIIEGRPAPDNAILIHCTAGKDRTGWMCALLLAALGVDRQTIKDDFLLTNTYFKQPADAARYRGGFNMGPEAMKVMWSVREEFLDAAFEVVDCKYGGMGHYLKNQIGLTDGEIEELRSTLLRRETQA